MIESDLDKIMEKDSLLEIYWQILNEPIPSTYFRYAKSKVILHIIFRNFVKSVWRERTKVSCWKQHLDRSHMFSDIPWSSPLKLDEYKHFSRWCCSTVHYVRKVRSTATSWLRSLEFAGSSTKYCAMSKLTPDPIFLCLAW